MNVNVNLAVESVIQVKNKIMINVDLSAKICENVFENIYILNHSTCTCENFKYLGSITGDSVIMCDEIIEATKTVLTNSNGKKVTCNVENFYILLTFLLINISLLIIIILIVFTVTS